MSTRRHFFYGDARGYHWQAWEDNVDGGVYLDVNRPFGEIDEGSGYAELEIEPWSPNTGARVTMFLPDALCEAIHKQVEERRKRVYR